MAKALYRTYRSKSFDEVVGQSHVTDLLKNAIKTGKISHAYLLTGPRGVGKTSVARIIAHMVNNLEYSEDQHLDIIEIDAASNRRIDDIRDLREKVHIAPVAAPYKVYIIDEVHMLTGESFNALLKTLEEPPEHAIFILATTEVHKVPATIISRTQRFHFRPATTTDIVSHLAKVAKKEKILVDTEALELIAEHASGSFRDSMSLLDQLSGLAETITARLVESVLGMAEGSQVTASVDALQRNDPEKLISQLDAILASGVSPIILTEQLMRVIAVRAKKDHSLYQLLNELGDVARAHNPQLKLIAIMVQATMRMVAPKTMAVASAKAPVIEAKISELTNKAPASSQSSISEGDTAELAVPSAPEEAVVQPARPEPSANTELNWTAVLAAVKKHNAPLHSVLARAEASYDAASTKLTLTFAYALHRKKLENQTYRKQFSTIMSNIFGIDPILEITDIKSTPAQLDGDAAAVAAIMGGGEPVHGAI